MARRNSPADARARSSSIDALSISGNFVCFSGVVVKVELSYCYF